MYHRQKINYIVIYVNSTAAYTGINLNKSHPGWNQENFLNRWSCIYSKIIAKDQDRETTNSYQKCSFLMHTVEPLKKQKTNNAILLIST